MTTTDTSSEQSASRRPRTLRLAVATVEVGVVLHVSYTCAYLGSGATVTAGRGLGSVGSVVVTAVICVLALLLALRMRAGANWARITLAVFATLELLAQFLAVFLTAAADSPAADGSIAPLVRVLVGIDLMVFLLVAFCPPVNAFFARHPRAGSATSPRWMRLGR